MLDKNGYAPIVLFVYNRIWHTKQTIEALQKNELAIKSELFIYSDAPKNDMDKASVEEVRKYIDRIGGFKKVTVIKREKNWGLAASIIDGVTSIVNTYEKIIVMEDDLITSPTFLEFMNNALNFYESEKKVWHISGWNYPLNKYFSSNKTFLWQTMNCWGWATWSNRWKYFEKNTDKLISKFTEEDIFRFNLDDEINFWNQILANKNKEIDTWAIYWYATIFKNNALCLNPVQTFVDNIGHDGSGENCANTKNYIDKLNMAKVMSFQTNISESKKYRKKVQMHNKSLVQKIKWILK